MHTREKLNKNFNGKAISLFPHPTLGCENTYFSSKYALNYAEIVTELRKNHLSPYLLIISVKGILQKYDNTHDLGKNHFYWYLSLIKRPKEIK